MSLLAHASDLDLVSEVADSDVWAWGSPIGLGAFIVAITLALALLTWTIKTLASIDQSTSIRRK